MKNEFLVLNIRQKERTVQSKDMLVLKMPSIKHSANLDMTERPDLQIIEIEEGEET